MKMYASAQPGYWDIRQENDRKAALDQQKLAIERSLAQSLGGLQGAQANEAVTRAGLAPKIFESEAAFRQANTEQVKLQNMYMPREAEQKLVRGEADIDYVRAGVGERKAQTDVLGATAGFTRTQAEQLRRSRIPSGFYSSQIPSFLGGGTGMSTSPGLSFGFSSLYPQR